MYDKVDIQPYHSSKKRFKKYLLTERKKTFYDIN